MSGKIDLTLVTLPGAPLHVRWPFANPTHERDDCQQINRPKQGPTGGHDHKRIDWPQVVQLVGIEWKRPFESGRPPGPCPRSSSASEMRIADRAADETGG
jgi:hypothetical protein